MNPAPGCDESFSVDTDHLRAKNQREGFLNHFGFRESPFGVTPNPEFLFLSSIHRQALQSMIDSIESNLGFTVLMGEPGTGKTTLLFQLMREYQNQARVAFVFQTQCRPHELLRYIASELQLPWHKRDEVSFHQRLNELASKEAHAGRRVLIIIDEAQNLQAPALEAVRLLSGFESGPAKLLHVILAGSARLGETLLSPELSQLAQRITTVCRLGPLTADEVDQYVKLRLEHAGSRESKDLFTAEALAQVAEESGGIPRRVNSLCYRALTLACLNRQHEINGKLVQQAARDLDLAEPTRILQMLKPAETLRKPQLIATKAVAAEDSPCITEAAPGVADEIFAEASTPSGKPAPESTEPDLLTRFAAALAKEQAKAGDVFKPQAERLKKTPPEKPPETKDSAEKIACAAAGDPLGESIMQRLYAEPQRVTAPASWRDRWGIITGGRKTSSSSSGAPAKRSLILLTVLVFVGGMFWLGLHELRARSAAPVIEAHGVEAAAPASDQQVAEAAAPATDAQPVQSQSSSTEKHVASLLPVAGTRPDIKESASTTIRKAAAASPSEAASPDHSPSDVTMIIEVPRSSVINSKGINSETGNSKIVNSQPGRQPSSAGDQPAPAGIGTLAAAANSSPVAVLTNLPGSLPRLASGSLVNEGSNNLKPTRVVQPVYPENAKLWHLEGDVALELSIGAKGSVRKVRVLRGNPILAQAATEAAQQWQYPPLPNGTSSATTQAQFKFRMDRETKK